MKFDSPKVHHGKTVLDSTKSTLTCIQRIQCRSSVFSGRKVSSIAIDGSYSIPCPSSHPYRICEICRSRLVFFGNSTTVHFPGEYNTSPDLTDWCEMALIRRRSPLRSARRWRCVNVNVNSGEIARQAF